MKTHQYAQSANHEAIHSTKKYDKKEAKTRSH
jgi:hypothetical protein